MTAQELHTCVKAVLPRCALGTVYRNLGLLCDEGRVARIPLSKDADVYELKKEPHDHMICVRCGKIRDVYIPGLSDAIDYQTGEKTLSYELTISYLCPDCKKGL